MKRKASISHDEAIIRRLRNDPDFAAEYLKAALEEEDEPRVLLIALRHLAQAQGIAKVAKAAGIERESLYRALSVKGNPRLSTLVDQGLLRRPRPGIAQLRPRQTLPPASTDPDRPRIPGSSGLSAV